MYEVTITHPAIEEQKFVCLDGAELRTLVYAVHRVQGQPVTDHRQVIAEVSDVRSRADFDGRATLDVGEAGIAVEPADEYLYGCEGHAGDPAAQAGELELCDGRCRPRRTFAAAALLELAFAIGDADLDSEGGCGACGLEVGQMCAGCGRCNCDRHDDCARPAVQPAR